MAILSHRRITPLDYDTPLREADARECEAGGFTTHEALAMSVEASLHCAVIEADGETAAFWGYSVPALLGTTANMWLLTTPVCDRHPIALVKTSRWAVERVQGLYPIIEVLVHIHHARAVRWLRHLGFIPSSEAANPEFMYMRKERQWVS